MSALLTPEQTVPSLPASVACLSKTSIELFTRFKAAPHEHITIGLAKNEYFHVRIHGGMRMGIDWPAVVPESRKVDSARGVAFLMPPTDTFALCLMLAWPDEQITYESEDAELKMRVLRAMIKLGDLTARTQANYKLGGIVPNHNLYYNAELPPTGYQQTACYCALKGLDGYSLLMKQGTGKTPVIIQVMDNECEEIVKETGRPYRAIIVCPNNVRHNWVNEINRFAVHKFRTTIISGDELARVKQFVDAIRIGDELGTVLIIGYDTLPAIASWLLKADWDLAALDEAHYIKNTKTRRFKTAIKLRDKARRRIIATGTPVANTPIDLYAMFEFLGKGYSGFYTEKGFRKFYGKYRIDPQHGAMLIGVQENRLPLLQERLARMSFSITLKEALPDLPDKVYDILECEMAAEQKRLYDQVASDINVQIQNELNKVDDSPITQNMAINNVLTMLLKLSQVTSGHLTFPEQWDEHGNKVQDKHTHVLKDNPKLDLLVETMLAKEPHQKTLIWACYTQDIHSIAERLRANGLDGVIYYGDTTEQQRIEAEYRYNNDPSCRWFVGNAGAGGTGLNLLGYEPHSKDPKTWTDHVIYYSQDWSYIKRDQSEARGHRRGTLTNVRITDLVIPNTVDEDIRVAVMDKKKMSLTLADIRPMLARVLGLSV